jgi:uncharacterized protein
VVKEEILNIARQFRSALIENGISVERLFLFGSYAGKTAGFWSDIDIAVVAPEFGKDRFLEKVLLAKIGITIDPRIEPYPIGSREFAEEAWRMMIHEIRTSGVEIAA